MRRVNRARRYGPLAFWLIAAAIVRSAIQAHGFHWTWIAGGLLVLMGVAWMLHDWRGLPSATGREHDRHHSQSRSRTAHLSGPTMVGFRGRMLAVIGVTGAVFAVACGGSAVLVFYEGGLRSGWGAVFGLLMVFGCGLFAQWAVFAFRGFRGRPALIVDAGGLTDQSFPNALGRVPWDEVEAIHWEWPGSVYNTRPRIAIERRNPHTPLTGTQRTRKLLSRVFGTRGIDPAKLAISDEELAHLFRHYSGGRFGIAQR